MHYVLNLALLVGLYFSGENLFALSGMPTDLKEEKNWNREFLEKFHEDASQVIAPSDFEEYKYLDTRYNQSAYPTGFTARGTPLVIYEHGQQLPDNYLYSNSCRNYGLSDIKKPDEPWQLGISRLFRFTSGQNRKLQSFRDGKRWERDNTKPFLFSGAFNPKPDDLEALSDIFSLQVSSHQLDLDVRSNKLGVYSDIGGGVEFNFKKNNGVLVGKIFSGSKLLGYEVCYKNTEVYCYARARVTYIDSFYNRKADVVKNTIVVADTKEKALAAYKSAYRADCSFVNEPGPDNTVERKAQCEASTKAVKQMVCADNVSSLPLKRVEDDNHGRYWFAPLDSKDLVNFW